MIQNHSNTFGMRPALRWTKIDVYIHVQVILIKKLLPRNDFLKSLLELFLSISSFATPKLDNRSLWLENYQKNCYEQGFVGRDESSWDGPRPRSSSGWDEDMTRTSGPQILERGRDADELSSDFFGRGRDELFKVVLRRPGYESDFSKAEIFKVYPFTLIIPMLVTDVGDKLCWWQIRSLHSSTSFFPLADVTKSNISVNYYEWANNCIFDKQVAVWKLLQYDWPCHTEYIIHLYKTK